MGVIAGGIICVRTRYPHCSSRTARMTSTAQRAIHPSGQWSGIIDAQIVATGQHGHASPGGRRALEHEIRERSARMCGYDEVVTEDRHAVERPFLEDDPSIQSRPYRHERVVELAAGRRRRRVYDERVWRGVVEDQQDVREEPMSSRQIDDAPASKEAAHPPRHLPCLVQLLARQAARVADGARQAIEE